MAEAHCWDSVIGDQERLVAGNYRRPRTMGGRPALLLIDLYHQVFGDRPQPLEDAIEQYPSSCGLAAWDALEPLQQLLATARAHGIPVAHTTGEDRPEARPGAATARRSDKLDASSAGFAIVESLRPGPGEFVVYKTRASGFFGTPLASWLRMQDVDTLVVGGESTSGCVRASVVDAFSHGFETMVCEEAVFDRSPLSHQMSLFDLHHKYATVAHLEAALRYLKAPSEAGELAS
jgi:maleamate amidohydrolase